MCGIAGIIGGSDTGLLTAMLERIRHRGPDGSGLHQCEDAAFGNVRLSIIDIAGGSQPIGGRNDHTWVVMNGELYGYQDIRDRYMAAGYPFRTRTDTEILLPLYEQYGLELFDHLNGMFAFALHDEVTETIIIARDHFGIKPLVYTTIADKLYFSSEIKSFFAIPGWTPRPAPEAWHAFFNIRFPPSPLTLFAGVTKLPPACYLLLSRKEGVVIPSGHVRLATVHCGDWHGGVYRYYQPPQNAARLPFAEALVHADRLFSKAVADQMIADVPVGVYLSGGIDSTAVTAYASRNGTQRINTFCLGFGEPTDENKDAAAVATVFHTSHTDVTIDVNPLDQFRLAIYHMEEPKVNCLQGFILAREAVRHQKVVLSGLGGDELFGGYDIYAIAMLLDLCRRQPQQSLIKAIGRLVARLAPASLHTDLVRRGGQLLSLLDRPLDLYLLLRNSWDHDAVLTSSIYNPAFLAHHAIPVREHFRTVFPEGETLAESFMRFEFSNKMVDDFLANEDRMAMASSLEGRVPFLDKHLVEFALSLPPTWKISLTRRKIFLKNLLRDRLPKHILNKKKHGFTFNPVLQARKDLVPFAATYLNRHRLEESGIFNPGYVEKILSARPHPGLRWHYFLLWKILGYHLWEDIFIREGGRKPS